MTSNGYQELLQLHPALSLTTNDRIKCGITGHEMVPKLEAVQNHINGKKFKRLAKEWSPLTEAEEALKSNEKFLVQHKKKETMLYCKLTGRSIKNETIHVQRHIRGKKFAKSLKHWQHCEKTGEKFKPMNLWGSLGIDDEDEEELVSVRKEEDDMADLQPWREVEKKEDEAMEEDNSGNYEKTSDVKSRAQLRKMKRSMAPHQKSVPVRRKTQKMEE